jgi:hypothetical protein
MKDPDELNLKPGDLLFVDSVRGEMARLVIGEEGERVETMNVRDLPEEGREEGVYLRVQPDGTFMRDTDRENSAREELDSLMGDIFGEPPPE